MKDYWFPILIGILVIGIMGLIWANIIQDKKYTERRNQQYQECKTKTSDLEWCFKSFKPKL